MNTDDTKNWISILGEFVDKDLEKEFFSYDMARTKKYLKPVLLILGILYFLFIIPDYFNIKNFGILMAILVNRILFLLLVLALYLTLDKFRNYEFLAYIITAYEITGIISFLLILGQYQSPNFLIQAFGVIIIVYGIFLVPNKLINTLIASILIIVAFLILSSYYVKVIKFSEYSAGVVYILIALVLSSIASFRNNYYNRKQYFYSKELFNLSVIDQLTGIFNRTKFNSELKQWLDYFKTHNAALSIVIFDIDNFKNINDTFGHLVGDDVIVKIANITMGSIRQNDLFARWGGEEFVLLLPNTDKHQAIELAERLRELIANNIFNLAGRVTCSFGVAIAREGDNATILLNRADNFLYEAKKAGKNMVVS